MLVMTAEGGEPKWLPCTKNLVEIVLMPGREEQTSIRLQCGISDSEGFDVLLGTDLIWGVGMTICTWKEKVKFRKQYWVRGSKTGELPVSFVKQEPKRAYTAEQTGTKGRGRAGLAGRAAAANAWQEPIKLVELFGGIGAGLAALLKAGVAVKEWIYVESNEKVRKMAEHHARKAATGGLSDPRGALLVNLLCVIDWIKEGQEKVVYLLEHLDLEGDCREPVRKVQELVTKKLGKGVRCDAARLGARAHRVRRYWQKIVADEQLQQELDGIRRDWGRTVKEILEPGRAAAPVRKGRHETQCPCNKVGAERRAWPTLVGYEGAAGFREEDGMPGEGMVYDSRTKKWEEPTALERELAMGYGEEVTKAVGVTERERRRALGQAMDGQVMLWLVRRMWRGLVLEEKKEQGSEGTRVKQVGAWACMAAKEEPKWVVGNAMSEKGKEAMQEVLARLVTDEPVFQRKRRMTPGDEDICKEKCRELMEARLIQRSESEYATPTVVAARKDLLGEVLSRRMCGDYRALNKVTVPDRYPMPTAEDIFDRLGAGEIFSTLDLRQGFNQIRIRKEDVRKTAFHGADGLYEWLFMPFGLRNASAIFQRVMDSVLRGLECAACYIDDVVIFSRTEDEHVRDVEQTLKALAAAGLTCHPKKCRWGEATVHYLGYEVRGGQLGIQQAKIEVLNRLQQPKDRSGLRAVLGFLSYYRRFVPNFSKRAAPLNGLLKEDRKWEWGMEQEAALKDLMEAVQTATIMQLPRADKPFCLYTDWSSQGMGAILCQELDGEERVVAYASRSCSPAEAKYSSYHGEGLAAVWAVKHFRVYLQGREFTLITDHQPLQWLMTHQGLTGRNARWAVTLQEYDFKIRHRPGKTLQHVDGLSRNPPAAEPVHTLMMLARQGEEAAAGKEKGPKDIWEDPAALRWIKGETDEDEQARARYMREMLPAALENLHTAQLRDAHRYEQRQQQGGRKAKPAVMEGQEVYLRRAKGDTLDVGLGTERWKVKEVRGSGVLVLENEKGERTVDHQTNAAAVKGQRPQHEGPVTRARAAQARAQEGAGSG
ncbi:unnamed protein product [Closterium sp. NIES-54]